MSAGKFLIYLIEDNKVDALVASAVIKKALSLATIHCFEDGLSPIGELQKALLSPTPALPHLIFLDMAMPGSDGFDFLNSYASLPIEHLPTKPLIFILTTSLSVANLKRAKSYPFVEDVLFKGFSHSAFTQKLSENR